MTDRHTYVRIDNRLLHGQVAQFWIPYLQVEHLIIADDLAASNPAMVSVYRMAIPRQIDLSVVMVTQLEATVTGSTASCILVVLSDVFDLARARMSGFDCPALTLGNIHSARGRLRITDTVHLTPEETDALIELHQEGKRIEIQTFPGTVLQLEWSGGKGAKWVKC